MGAGAGDKLARGASRASFPPAGQNVSQDKWDAIFGPNTGLHGHVKASKPRRKSRKKSS